MAGRPVHTFEVVRTEQLTPHMARWCWAASGFDTFTPDDFTDSYVKIVFVRDGIDVCGAAAPADDGQFQRRCPSSSSPPCAPTPCASVDTERGEITIDFVVHGEHGVAGPWAAAAHRASRHT